jgi:hypothetical protein
MLMRITSFEDFLGAETVNAMIFPNKLRTTYPENSSKHNQEKP